MRDAGKHATMPRTGPHISKHRLNLTPNVNSIRVKKKLCSRAVTLCNKATISPNLYLPNSKFQIPEEGFLIHFGSSTLSWTHQE